MARLWTSGAEWNNTTAEGVVLNGATFSTTNPRTGTYAFRQTTNNNATWSFAGGAVGTTYYFRAYVYVSSLPAGEIAVLAVGDSTGGNRVYLALQPDGTIQLKRVINTQIGSASAAISAGTYLQLELAYLVGVGAADYVEGRINGSSFASGSSLSITDIAPTLVAFAFGDGTITTDTDDLAFNDSSGASQNSWPGSGKVTLHLPISDNARTTGWVTGAGGTTNLWDAVNNTPPVGVADTGTATSQIRNASAEASASYDANLTTYTTAGIGAADTINVVVPMVATAAPVTTSSKQGLIGMASNPAITTVALSAAGTAGAFWAGAAAAAYPTGWKWSFGTTTYAPAVTKGNSPVARITQVTSSTRIADVCALGMYVDYTPAAVDSNTAIFERASGRRRTLLRM